MIPFEKIQKDTDLIRRAQMAATGATIHRINHCLCLYGGQFYSAEVNTGWTFRSALRVLRYKRQVEKAIK